MLHKMGFEYQTESSTYIHDDVVDEYEANVQRFLDDGMPLKDAHNKAEGLIDERLVTFDVAEGR